jgi:poly(hydroxyalkanoate) depolymerase family esterase
MLRNMWSRAKALFARVFRRKPPEPGRFESDARTSLRGMLATAPWIWPARDYTVYVPQGHARWRSVPLLVLLHGCRQTADDVAQATRITALADKVGCLVLLPRQNPRANTWGCWNWFDRATVEGWGETAIVLAQVKSVRRKYRIDPRRVFVAGMSSGGGLATVLGIRKPEVVAGVFVHSGIACGAASSPLAALAVLKTGADNDVTRIARAMRLAAQPETLPVPLLVVHGDADDVVSPVNAAQLVRQYLALNGHPAADAGAYADLPPPDRSDIATMPDAGNVTTSEWRVGGRLVARHVLVDRLGHAWSGGNDAYAYTDPRGPDASALLGAFVSDPMQ